MGSLQVESVVLLLAELGAAGLVGTFVRLCGLPVPEDPVDVLLMSSNAVLGLELLTAVIARKQIA